MQKRILTQATIATISGLPLFYGVSSVGEAAFLSASVLFAVFVFEIIFSLTKCFWLHSLRPLFALLILTSVLSGIFLACNFLLLDEPAAIHTFPLTLASAFLLVQSTLLAGETSSNRIRVWLGFSALLLIVGVSRHLNETFQEFLPAPFWVSGIALGVFFFSRRKEQTS